jgi:hypothetical protein
MNVGKYGVCPVAVEQRLDTINNGKNAGRACWAIAGTFCYGERMGPFRKKYRNCLNCTFYKKVFNEEKDKGYSTAGDILSIIKAWE